MRPYLHLLPIVLLHLLGVSIYAQENPQENSINPSDAYRLIILTYFEIGEEFKAIDTALDWLEKDNNAVFEEVLDFVLSSPNYSEEQITLRTRDSAKPLMMKGLLTRLYEHQMRYCDAIRIYNEVENEYGPSKSVNFYRSLNYMELGMYDEAIKDISTVIDSDPSWYYLCFRGDFYLLAGKYYKAFEDYTTAMKENLEKTLPHYLTLMDIIGFRYE